MIMAILASLLPRIPAAKACHPRCNPASRGRSEVAFGRGAIVLAAAQHVRERQAVGHLVDAVKCGGREFLHGVHKSAVAGEIDTTGLPRQATLAPSVVAWSNQACEVTASSFQT
jgi:hypothetical protein